MVGGLILAIVAGRCRFLRRAICLLVLVVLFIVLL